LNAGAAPAPRLSGVKNRAGNQRRGVKGARRFFAGMRVMN
jgi:hypothetical protein